MNLHTQTTTGPKTWRDNECRIQKLDGAQKLQKKI
jgi:hypothetical protein